MKKLKILSSVLLISAIGLVLFDEFGINAGTVVCGVLFGVSLIGSVLAIAIAE